MLLLIVKWSVAVRRGMLKWLSSQLRGKWGGRGELLVSSSSSESLIKRNAYLPIPLHTPLIAFWLLSSGWARLLLLRLLLLLLILIPWLLCVLCLYGAAFPVFQQYSLCPALSPLIVLTLLRATHSCSLSLSLSSATAAPPGGKKQLLGSSSGSSSSFPPLSAGVCLHFYQQTSNKFYFNKQHF